jgi:hypothetical protein
VDIRHPTRWSLRDVASACVWSSALQAGPVLILQLRSPSRSGGQKGFLVHALEILDHASTREVLDDDLGVKLDPVHGYVRSYLVH